MQEIVLSEAEQIKKALNKAKYGWSKWGGSNFGLVQKNLTNTWFCQACKEEQTDNLPPYMFEFCDREYIRICSKCHNLRLIRHIQRLQFTLLCDLVRAFHPDVEYLP